MTLKTREIGNSDFTSSTHDIGFYSFFSLVFQKAPAPQSSSEGCIHPERGRRKLAIYLYNFFKYISKKSSGSGVPAGLVQIAKAAIGVFAMGESVVNYLRCLYKFCHLCCIGVISHQSHLSVSESISLTSMGPGERLPSSKHLARVKRILWIICSSLEQM